MPSDKYYQKYGPMRRRRRPTPGDEQPQNIPLDISAEFERQTRTAYPPLGRMQRRRPRPWSLIFTTFLLVAGILAAPYVLAFALPLINGERVPQGVSIQGMDVTGMDRTQLISALETRYEAFRITPVTLSYDNHSWTPAFEDMGVNFDLQATADLALGVVSHGSPIERLQTWWQLWRGGRDIAPVMHIDTAHMQAYVLRVAGDLERPPRDAALSLEAGKVLPTSAQLGRQLLVDQTVLEMIQGLTTLQPQSLSLRTRDLEPGISDAAMAPAIAEAETLLSTPLVLREGERSWTWDQERLASLAVLKTESGKVQLQVDPERLARQIEKLAQVVDSGSVEPRVAFNASGLQIVTPGKIGLRLNQAEAVKTISAALKTSGHDLRLPVEQLSPQITEQTLPSLGIVELVSEGRSSFAGSAEYRITNIKAGAQRMNGVLIAPNAEFSFNTQLGEVDQANGFVQGYAVIGNRTQLEWGGGVCQVSTTVFRSAFWAGVPITERHAHPFYISWYDAFSFPDQAAPGMDATIYTGVQDFKFVNDTGKWLLMETEVDEAQQILNVRLYGTRPNRSVTVLGPDLGNVVPPPAEPVYITDPALPAGTLKQTDVARQGMDISVYRVIEDANGKHAPEEFFTRFKAWPDVFVRGIGSP